MNVNWKFYFQSVFECHDSRHLTIKCIWIYVAWLVVIATNKNYVVNVRIRNKSSFSQIF